MSEKACDGGRVLENGDMAECVECGTEIRWDMQDHPFWGFKSSCPNRRASQQRTAAAVDPHVGSTGKLSTRDSKCSNCVHLEQETTALQAQNEALKKELSRALGSPGDGNHSPTAMESRS